MNNNKLHFQDLVQGNYGRKIAYTDVEYIDKSNILTVIGNCIGVFNWNKPIIKYLDPNLQDKDIEQGKAPTIDTIIDWCGKADLVEADQNKTKIIRPEKMFNEDGSYSDEYNFIIKYLETQIQKAKNENAGITEIASLKRRLNSFKGSMVDFLVGGITLSDKVNILQKPTAIGKAVGSVKKNQVFTIIQENNGYGLLKSKVGWIKLDKNVKKSK